MAIPALPVPVLPSLGRDRDPGRREGAPAEQDALRRDHRGAAEGGGVEGMKALVQRAFALALADMLSHSYAEGVADGFAVGRRSRLPLMPDKNYSTRDAREGGRKR